MLLVWEGKKMKEHFETISDPRQPWKIEYSLLEIVIMTICAVISNCDDWEDIVDFCRVKESWFREKLNLELKNGISSHDTFQRIFQLINPEELEQSFLSWVKSIAEKTKGEIISIDGKTVCGSRDNKTKAIHMVGAWANANQLALGQVKTEEKSNEITAIPTLLDLLELKDCIVTIDAMGCQKDIAEKITKAEADYVFGLKGNHETLHNDVKLYFEDENLTKTLDKTAAVTEKDHGRIETREYYLETKIDWLWQKSEWTGLKAIGMVKSRVREKDEVREDTRYFITSLTDVQLFAKAVRSHWGIENSLHWCLDVVFREDNCRTRKDNSAENFAVIRRIALNILKLFPAKMSVSRKRKRCSYDAEFMADVLLSAVL
jgi:predicted transposase YbfD/YdcC